jgi:hypothetical protein
VILKLKWSSKSPRDPQKFLDFVQRQANRLIVGEWRYGAPNRRQLYMSRLEKELEAYKKDGNVEQLINIANYAFLESIEPEHPQAHFDNLVASRTRHQFGGARREGD